MNTHLFSSAFRAGSRRIARSTACATALLIAGASVAQAADGDLDTAFGAEGQDRGANDYVYASAVKPDGKVVIGGFFTAYDGVSRNRVAQLNPDGSVDLSFNPGTGVSAPDGANVSQNVLAVAVQGDGKILIGGDFTGYNGTAVRNLARINPDGSLDSSFNAGGSAGFAGNNTVQTILVQPDGKILVGGTFFEYNNNVLRLNADGSRDSTFATVGANGPVYAIALTPEGKIVIGGGFTAYGDTSRFRIARLTEIGTLDPTFNPGSGADQYLQSIALQKDGKIIIGGIFANYNGAARNSVARVNTDGSNDATFNPGTGIAGGGRTVVGIGVQFDGRIVLAGFFSTYNGVEQSAVVRVLPDGTLDTSFKSGARPFDDIRTFSVQPDGKLIIGGIFIDYQGILRNYVARLLSTPPPPPPNPGPPLPAPTGFTVNDSATGFAVDPDSVLRLRVTQPSTLPRLTVRVQTSTAPDDEASWADLNNGSSGRMIRDVTNDTYVLNTTSHPRVANLHFRVIAAAPGNSASTSNVVGPFNLQSATQHLGRTVVSIASNGPAAPIYVRAFEETQAPGVSMRVQTATSPGDEGNWTDLDDGRGGKMTAYGDTPGQFYLDTTNYPANGSLYFRVVSSAAGYVDSPSRGVGPFDLINSAKPVATVTSPADFGGVGDEFDFPIVLQKGDITIAAEASSSERGIKQLVLLYDGESVGRYNAPSGSTTYTPQAPGDHVVEAFAADELGVIGDAKPVFVRIEPAGGRIFNRVADGDWNDASMWLDQALQNGVPGPNDLASVRSFNVTVSGQVTVLALSLNGGSIGGDGALTVTGTFTVAAGTVPIRDLIIASSGTLLLANNDPVGISGSILNEGAFTILGRGGITGTAQTSSSPSTVDGRSSDAEKPNFFADLVNRAKAAFNRWLGGQPQPEPPAEPTTPPAPPILPREVAFNVVQSAGIVSGGGGNIVSGGGGNIISSDGASLLPGGGVGIVSGGGGNIISSDGASLLGQDGAGFSSAGGAAMFTGQGAGGAPALAARSVTAEAATAGPAGFTQTGGRSDLSGIKITGNVALTGGVLSGNGLIDGSLTNDGGSVAPGNSAGVLGITGDFIQTASGTLLLEIGGPTAAEYDRVNIGGEAALGGELSVTTINGFTPDANAPLLPITYGSATGEFDTTSGNVQLDLRDTGAALTVAGPNPAAPEIVVEQPLGSELEDGMSSVQFPGTSVGSSSAAKTFTIRNSGDADLTGIAVTIDGNQTGDFVVDTTGTTTTLAPEATTTFTVTFAPSALGSRDAALHISSNDADEQLFDIAVTGSGTALPVVRFTATNYATSENVDTFGGRNARLTVTRDGNISGTSTIEYSTTNGTAAAGSDYTAAVNGTFTFDPDVRSGDIIIAIIDDAVTESAETFTVTLSNPSGATLGSPATATATISDNDAATPTPTPTATPTATPTPTASPTPSPTATPTPTASPTATPNPTASPTPTATPTPTPSPSPSPKMLNIATRLRVERGQDALIGGFIITGSAPKRVIVRALGPSLEARGIAGGLVDPTLELFSPDGSTFNNNWRDSQAAEIVATTIPPSDEREAAIVATLQPGVAYTAVVAGIDDTTGVGLVEVYDLDAAAPSTLANISTRGLVQTGENVMIGGLIIGGEQPATILIRALGPSLGEAGVAGALEDPTLELYNEDGDVITNDNWRSTQESEITATTVPPSDDREAAILATLPAGNYTAVVRGTNNTTGVALVEAYNLQ